MATTKPKSTKITEAEVRMYRMGTGDCFVIKFFAGKTERFKMMIDCGTWSGKKEDLAVYIKDLKAYVNNSIDLLVVTHEHKDHVYGFDACEELFTNNFDIKKIWLAWTERDGGDKVEQWKKDYGDKKAAVALAAANLQKALASPAYARQFAGNREGDKMLGARKNFADALQGFADLHLSAKAGVYVNGLEGMEVVKKKLVKNNKHVKYLNQGDIEADILGDAGVKFYVLGPPNDWEDIRRESGKDEHDTYGHNNDLSESDAFALAMSNYSSAMPDSALPFDPRSIDESKDTETTKRYNAQDWRKIDYDWMYGAGSLALRINSITNNLSLALAIEFEGTEKKPGRVMLFPGDAEFGSWASWHKIKWAQKGKDGKHFTEDLLNRTVLYKVAHHLSHNGTAKRQGLEMMIDKDLAAMATLDYSAISGNWKTTMPNRAIISELLTKTKGRLMIMNENDLFSDLDNKVPLGDSIIKARTKMSAKERTAFINQCDVTNDLYIQYRVKA
jgi:hypothetical protein